VPDKTSKVDMEKIVSLCKRRGFIFPGSEIYGGLGSCWDYGPLGVELKRNIKDGVYTKPSLAREIAEKLIGKNAFGEKRSTDDVAAIFREQCGDMPDIRLDRVDEARG
jgi:hypothetical protein